MQSTAATVRRESRDRRADSLPSQLQTDDGNLLHFLFSPNWRVVQARCHGHSVTVVTAVKRFFKCGGCGAKTSALNTRFPTWGCDRCKRGDWTQCSMYGKRKVRAALEVLCALKGRLPALLASLHCLPPSAARTRWACRIRAPRSMFGKVCNDHSRLQCYPAGARCAKKEKKKKKEKNPKQKDVGRRIRAQRSMYGKMCND